MRRTNSKHSPLPIQHSAFVIPHSLSAFTLIELLIVTAILAVVIGVIGACLAGGIRVWDSAQTFNTLERDAFVGLTLMEKDLMNALPIYAIGFDCQASSLKFPALLESDEVLEVGTVEYSLDESVRALKRREEAYPQGEEQAERLVENVEIMELAYFRLVSVEGQTVEWREIDAGATNFPDKVEITLALADGDRTIAITKTVLMPVRGR